MTPLTCFIIGFILFYLLKCRKKISDLFIYITALAITLEIMTSIGYFLKIGNFEIGHSEFVILFDTIIAIYILLKDKINRELLVSGVIFTSFCAISLGLQTLFPYNGPVVAESSGWDKYYFLNIVPDSITLGFTHIKEVIHVICFVIIFMAFMNLEKNKKELLLLKAYGFEKVFIWYGLVEAVCVKILDLHTPLLELIIFFAGDSYAGTEDNISIGVGRRLRGFKSEPSMYGFALLIFVLLAIYMVKKYKNKKDVIYIVITLILMLSSLAFSSLVCLVWLTLFILVIKYQEGNLKQKHSIVILSITGIMLAVFLCIYFYSNEFNNYYLRRIHMALINLNDLSIGGWTGDYATYDGSTKIRLVSMVGTLQYFLKRPLFGLALGSTYSHSSLATILASIGLTGTIAWLKFTFFPGTQKRSWGYKVILTMWLALLLISGVGLFQFYGVENIIIFSVFDYVDNLTRNHTKADTCYVQRRVVRFRGRPK